MNKFAEGLGIVIVGFLIIAAVSVLAGTILWLVWEDSVAAMFPKAVENGVLAATITWWQAVKISWVFNILIKTTTTTTSSKKD